MVNEIAIKEAFTKIRNDMDNLKIELQKLNQEIKKLDYIEEWKWREVLDVGRRKARWDGNGSVKE